MKSTSLFLLVALALGGDPAYASMPVADTLGGNLTAYNGASGAINNNNWNNMMNPRAASANAPTADFGNCNALIMRCAQPKCATGGCTSLDVTTPIVTGCIKSNPTCEQYGADLVSYIAAQLVANTNARANADAAAQTAAAAAAAQQQSAMQLQQMQSQMEQMRAEMAAQNNETINQLQTALAEQQQQLAAAQAQQVSAAAAPVDASADADVGDDGLTAAQRIAAESGVSADILAREQISGQIRSKLENAKTALKSLETTMMTAFNYAGCDKNGNNCNPPARVSAFKQRAGEFFEPYNTVLDELYDALILAQSVGVDITDIYMMLNGTCNAWAQYLCSPGQVMHYTSSNCNSETGLSRAERTRPVKNGDKWEREVVTDTVRGGQPCKIGQVVPMNDNGCQLVKMLTSNDEVQRNWLYPAEGNEEGVEIRVGCASEALENSALFRNRKKQASIDIETLERMVTQDAPSAFGSGIFGTKTNPDPDGIKYCAVNTLEKFSELQQAASLRTLPKTVCVNDKKLAQLVNKDGVPLTAKQTSVCKTDSNMADSPMCTCENAGGFWDNNDGTGCRFPIANSDAALDKCVSVNGMPQIELTGGYSCVCPTSGMHSEICLQAKGGKDSAGTTTVKTVFVPVGGGYSSLPMQKYDFSVPTVQDLFKPGFLNQGKAN